MGWIIAPLFLCIMIFGTTKKELSPLGAVLYTGIGKSVWSLGIAWFIVACTCGRGGIINRILSAKCLLPYSRMTYTAYLINPLCIMFVVMMSEAPIHLDFLSLVSRMFARPMLFFPRQSIHIAKYAYFLFSWWIVWASKRLFSDYHISLCWCLKIHSYDLGNYWQPSELNALIRFGIIICYCYSCIDILILVVIR